MSIWEMSGAELSTALAVPAAPEPVAYPGASDALRPVLGLIAGLSAADQAALAKAFRAAEPAKKRAAAPKMLGSRTFRSWAEFQPVFSEAKAAAQAAGGPQWYLDPAVALYARVPAAWSNCKLFNGKTSPSPRDIHCPRAEFWPGGVLPVGPDYAEYPACANPAEIRAQRETEREASRAKFAAWFPDAVKPAPAFEMEHTPEDIGVPAFA